MTLEEFYKTINGDYQDVLSRLMTDARIEKYAIRFASETNEIDELKAGLQEEDWNKAFLGAHTLKGIGLNLGFTLFTKAFSDLTEELRSRSVTDRAKVDMLFELANEQYEATVKAIQKYAASKQE